MILLIAAYLFLKGTFWCFAAMIWLCFAAAGAMLVLIFALCCIPLGISGRIVRSGMRSLAPPAYLRKSRT